MPEINYDFLKEFTLEKLRSRPTKKIDPTKLGKKISSSNQEVLAIDIGGNKVAVASYSTSAGILGLVNEYDSPRSQDGEGYLGIIKTAARTARTENLPVGISFAGPVRNGKPVGGPNIPVLLKELEQYNGNLEPIFGPHLRAVENDDIAGLTAAIYKRYQEDQAGPIIFITIGSGFNGSVYKSGEAIATEVGHIRAPEEFNPFHRDQPCHMFGNEFTCIENVAAGKAGIEETWHLLKSKESSAIDIQNFAISGDNTAIELYNNSAAVAVHAALGLANAHKISLDPVTAIMFHGGIFTFEPYRKRVLQLLEEYGVAAEVTFTRDFSKNACLDGAAIAAIAAD